MGNRAVLTVDKKIGIYVHWNGGYTSVRAFLDYCKLKGYRNPSYDKSYAMARLCEVICNFFGGDSSVGIGAYENLDTDNGDNGVYIIGDNWQIVGREFADIQYDELEKDDYYDILESINDNMPEGHKIDNLFEKLNKQRMKEILEDTSLTLDEKIALLKKVGL